MMSKSLYRLGRLAAGRPWVVIGSWLVLAVVVVGASSAFGHRLKDATGDARALELERQRQPTNASADYQHFVGRRHLFAFFRCFAFVRLCPGQTTLVQPGSLRSARRVEFRSA